MAKLLMSIDMANGKEPTLKAVCAKLHIKAESIDQEYGFVLIDPEKNTYAFLVDEAVAFERKGNQNEIKGPFSNPKIQPFNLEDQE